MNIINPPQIKESYKNIICNVRKNQPEARINGVLLSKQTSKGVEVIVGMIKDSQFGPTVMFGQGWLSYPESWVARGMKVGDIDPRGIREFCFTVSDKARSLGGAVLEAICAYLNKK